MWSSRLITTFSLSSLVLVLAALIDYLVSDPKGWLHPTIVMGWLIKIATKLSLSWTEQKEGRRLLGILLNLGLVLGSAGLSWSIIKVSTWLHPLLGLGVECSLLASCFAARSLRNAAMEVISPLVDGASLSEVRLILSQYVGRDTGELSEIEILRAVLETVAENTTDGVTAPLFYAILGALIPGVGPVPVALAYKAASTLDSMIGYRKEPYIDLGWFSARLEDYLTWIPCRLTVLTLALYSKRPQAVLALCRRDGPKDPSPNSGWSECVYAAILNVRLGGNNSYQGVIKEKPLLGDDKEPISPGKIEQALNLMRVCFLLWLAVGVGILAVQKGLL